ncbi:SIR2 family protein [Granulicella sp. L46]|uniref:SIR2 family protein n=1 Tax=Granulicella sp. L46 TaxID=1641865 RepID=UPI00131C0ECB|nr:SIR2 family protein [Granulicella sp. L46]
MNDQIQKCKDILLAGKLIPFVGAGLSARFRFPTWSGLLDLIAEDLSWDPDVFKLSGDYLQLAEYYVAQKGSVGELRSKLDKLLNASDEDIIKSKAHEKLSTLNFPLIYTTNYEDTIERAFKLHGKDCHVIANIDHLQEMRQGVPQIVKFHGTFTDDESLVLTESDYFERLEFESPLDIKLRGDMLGKTLLFLGYSFSDMNIRLMLYKLMKLRKAHKLSEKLPTAIMTGSSFTPIQRNLLEKWDVVVVELNPMDQSKGLDDFMENLS